MTRVRTFLLLTALFAISVAVRRPLFNHEFTGSWEWLSAHTLLTAQLWDATPASVHHFNLLYTFPGQTDKFIDDLWQSGVPDRLGNYYYVSMPHLAFLTPYVFFKLTALAPTIAHMQVFALCVHFLVCWLLYLLIRKQTEGLRSSRIAAAGAFCVMLWAPTALFFYQNAVVGTVLVIPYTIGVLYCVTRLTQNQGRGWIWLLLFGCLLLGCLTDWQAYFTAFTTAVVLLVLSRWGRVDRAIALRVASLCVASVVLAVSVLALQDSRINGFQPFVHTILGRFRVRAGASSAGLGLTTSGYYRNMARFYFAYLPYILLAIGLIIVARRRAKQGAWEILQRAGVAFRISLFALVLDHLILANHTSQQSFTTLNALVPIGILAGLAVAAFLETSSHLKRDLSAVALGFLLCIGISIGEYYVAYMHRPQPYRTASLRILQPAEPSDVLFATGDGFKMPSDFIIPQFLFYLRHNVLVVQDKQEADQFLACHGFTRGVLAHVTDQYAVSGVETLNSSGTPCAANAGHP